MPPPSAVDASEPEPHATRRAPRGMVCTVDHLASHAGLAQLRAGGSAADAAICASAVVAVTAPHLCGMGGDLWALVHDGTGAPVALDGAGAAGSGADPQRLRAEGHREMPFEGDVRSVPVPGCVDGWLLLHERFGTRPMAELLGPAITYARDGFPASALLAGMAPLLEGVEGAGDLLVDPPLQAGQRVRRPGVARCLEAIAAAGRDGFYRGEFGEGFLALGAGEFTESDLEARQARWRDPLSVTAWGYRIWEPPPPSQGYTLLVAAALAAGLDLGGPDDARRAHLLVEATKAAAWDRPALLHEGADGGALVDPAAIAVRRERLHEDRASAAAIPASAGDTTYLCAVDEQRRGVSLIQSNASGFGAGLAVGRTGVLVHNRGVGFSLEEGHPAAYGPRRRPPSTLSPALVTTPDGALRALVGTMGGDAQPQILLQLLTALLRDGRSPGPAVRAPRWVLGRPGGTGFDVWTRPGPLEVRVEADAPGSWTEGLRARGHRVASLSRLDSAAGHAQALVLEGDLVAGAADPRALVGAAAGF